MKDPSDRGGLIKALSAARLRGTAKVLLSRANWASTGRIRPDPYAGGRQRTDSPARSPNFRLHHAIKSHPRWTQAASGWGREMGKEVMEHYTETKSVAINLV
jgi:hypothetical protein